MKRALWIVAGASALVCGLSLAGAFTLGGQEAFRPGGWTVAREGVRWSWVSERARHRHHRSVVDGSGPEVTREMPWEGYEVLALDVPADVRARLGRRVFRQTLQTDSRSVAERRAAPVAHLALYAFQIALPLSGWALVSVSMLEIPSMPFKLFVMPNLPLAESDAAESFWAAAHWYLAYAGIALVVLHVAAALRHHFRLRDNVLTRMITPLSGGE